MVLGGGFMMMAAGVAGAPGVPGAIIGLIYIAMAILYIIPAVFQWRSADRIASFLVRRTPDSLGYALEAQKSFWKFVGILTLIVLCIYALIALFGIFGAIATTM